MVPELNYASRFYSRMLKQLRIYPALMAPNGEAVRTDDELPVQQLSRIQDPGGGRSQILGKYGELMFATGEGLLFGRDLLTDDEQWSFVWTDEINIETTGSGRDKKVKKIIHKPYGSAGDAIEYGPDQAVAYRMWTSHPRLSGEATSPLRAGLRVAEELIALGDAVLATATSRKTSGILVIPMELAPPPAEGGSDEDPKPNPFMASMIDHITAATENPGTPESVAPFLLWAQYEYLDRIKLIPLHNTQNDYAERDLRTEAVMRLARGMDMPPEVLTGLSDSNHWAARQILDDMWRSHGAPIAEQFCDDLNQAYFRPILREAGYPNWNQIVIGYDESQIVVKPDRSDDADEAFDRAAIGYEGYLEMKDIPQDYAPDADERALILEVLRKGRSPEQPDGANPNADQGPPDAGAEGDSGRRTRVVASGASLELGAAEMALQRCRELAGMRIRNQEKRCPDCLSEANGKPTVLVAASIGADNVTRLKLDPRELVKGGTDPLRTVLANWGYSAAQAGTICEMVELWAARTLFDKKTAIPSSVESQIAQIKGLADAA